MAEILGGCLCGAVRYRITGPPASSTLCHCVSCRKAHAAQSVPWLSIALAQFAISAGAPRGFHSSPGVTRRFCAACGTPIAYENDAHPALIDIATMTLDEAAAFPPTAETWLDHKLSWVAVHPSLLHFAQGGLGDELQSK